MITTVVEGNLISIPAELAEAAGIQPESQIDWSVDAEGHLIGRLLPSRSKLARKAQGMGKSWLREGDDPIADLIAERLQDDDEEGVE